VYLEYQPLAGMLCCWLHTAVCALLLCVVSVTHSLTHSTHPLTHCTFGCYNR
jgi:hypothetical protein